MDFENFYEGQREAICHKEKPMLVLAGPGSGKTTVIVHRVKYLIESAGVSPDKILVITFTKAAAAQMKDRFFHIMGVSRSSVTFATFHSLFFRILRSVFGYGLDQIVSEEERWRLLKGWMIELEVETNDREEAIRSFLAGVSLLKSEMIKLSEFQPEGIAKEDFDKLYKQYEGYKERNEKLDFDDMLVSCYQLLQEEPGVLSVWQQRYEYILIDEFQDVNCAQYETIRLLAKPQDNLFVVGDDDQSIYAFRGARPDFMLSFTKDYPQAQRVTLNRNFRSSEKIVKLSERIISHNQNRFPKNMVSVRGGGKKTILLTCENAVEEGKKIAKKIADLYEKGVPYGEMAVICRTNIQGGLYGALFGDRGIPYILKDKGINPWSHWITQDLLAYLALAADPSQDEAAKRIVNKPKRYISKAILLEAAELPYPLLKSLPLCRSLKPYQQRALQEWEEQLKKIRRLKPYEALRFVRQEVGYDSYLQEYANFTRANLHGYMEIADEATEMAKDLPSWEVYQSKIQTLEEDLAARGRPENQPQDGVAVSTMHSAKGLEFQAVFIPSIVEGVIPHEKSSSPAALEEERRLFYVAVTRAKERLYLSEVKKRHENNAARSRFLKELGIR